MQRLARCVPSMFQKDMTRGEVLRYALAYRPVALPQHRAGLKQGRGEEA